MVQEKGEVKVITKKLIRHRVGLTYPEIIGLEDEKVQKSINEIIQEEIYKMIVEQGYEEDFTKEIWGDYKVKLNSKGLLSILLYVSSYSKGAAHGLTAVKSVNMSVKDGNIYEIDALFKKSSNYIDRINDIIKEEIQERDIPLLVEFETIDKRQDFYLTPDTLVIFFQLYEYTPYTFGIPEFVIPHRLLADIIEENSPLKHLLK